MIHFKIYIKWNTAYFY